MKSIPWHLTILMLLPFTLIHGCSDSTSTSSDSHKVVIPETFDETGDTWEKVDGFTDSDTNRLKTYFEKNPSVAEHSIIHGDPVVYQSDKKRRYYWVRGGLDGVEWLYVELNGQNAKLTDGFGPPFFES